MINEIKIFNQNINSFSTKLIKTKNVKFKKVFFLRNEQVESFADKVNNYSLLSKLKFKFYYSSYDSSLTIPKNFFFDVSVIWLDYTHYQINKSFFDFIKNKVNELSAFSNYVLIKPIIKPSLNYKKTLEINNKFKKKLVNDKAIFLDIIDEIFENKKDFWDIERSNFFGTKTSIFGQDLFAKLLGFKVLPSLYKQKIKAIVFDLDDTLYSGVIGEDGINKIYLDQNQIKAKKMYSLLHKEGTLLSICSKNNEKDLIEIFKKKLLLQKLFFPIKANWKLKSCNIKEIQKILRISFHNILFIDNNINEILEVKNELPSINVFWANNSKSLLNCLKYYPNLKDYFGMNSKNKNNLKRILDLKASLRREELIKNAKDKIVPSLLKVNVDFRLNNKREFERIFSLTNKVNQFIFTHKRFSKAQVTEYLNSNDKFVFTISVKDKFSDSGNIGVIFFSKKNNSIFLDELCVSCRALGRNLEDFFLFYPLKILSKKVKFDRVIIEFLKSSKNQPAYNYFNQMQKKMSTKKISKDKIEILFSEIKKLNLKMKDVFINFKN